MIREDKEREMKERASAKGNVENDERNERNDDADISASIVELILNLLTLNEEDEFVFNGKVYRVELTYVDDVPTFERDFAVNFTTGEEVEQKLQEKYGTGSFVKLFEVRAPYLAHIIVVIVAKEQETATIAIQ